MPEFSHIPAGQSSRPGVIKVHEVDHEIVPYFQFPAIVSDILPQRREDAQGKKTKSFCSKTRRVRSDVLSLRSRPEIFLKFASWHPLRKIFCSCPSYTYWFKPSLSIAEA
jgi:hypothetical protein